MFLTSLTLIPEPLQHALIVADNVADSEDSEDEWDYYRADPNKQESAVTTVTAADESRKDVEEQSAQENPESVADASLEVQTSEPENDIKCEDSVNSFLPELSIDVSLSCCFSSLLNIYYSV